MTKILVIDDDPEVRVMVARTLARTGNDVFQADNGRDGLAIYREERPDLVITDIFMPNMDGLEVTRSLLAVDPDVHVLAMSGGGSTRRMEYLDHAHIFGAQATISKPFTPSELLAQVNRLGIRICVAKNLKG